MQRTISYLSRRATSLSDASAVVGRPSVFDVSGLAKDRVVFEQGEGGAARRVVLEPDEGEVRFTPTSPGVWRLFADSDRELQDLSFAAHVAPEEGEPKSVDEATMRSWLGGGGESGETGRGPERRVNLWPTILFLVTLALLFETILGTRRSVMMKLWRAVARRGRAQA